MVGKTDISRCCCGDDCVYEASDGNEYSDTFGSLDAGWLEQNVTNAVSGGRLQVTSTMVSIVGMYTYRELTIAGAGFLVIAEVQLYPSASAGRAAATLGISESGKADFQIQAQTAEFHVRAFGTTYMGLGSTPADGDKVTIQLLDIGSGRVRACFYVNEELILSAESLWTFADPQHVLLRSGWDGSPVTCEYDTFTLHFGNP